MARHCLICQGEAKLAVRLHGEGKSLAEIRRAIDAKFG
jgi:phosphoribosyl-dephospho-CoA transferase